MENEIIFVIVVKSTAMLLAIIIGFIALYLGYQLFKNGAGTGRERIVFDFGEFKIHAHSAGCVIMATSFLWGIVGFELSPNYKRNDKSIEIYSLYTPNSNLKLQTITAKAPNYYANDVSHDPNQLLLYFKNALASIQQDEKYPQLNGKRVDYNLNTLEVVKMISGKYYFTTEVSNNQLAEKVVFTAELKGDQINFIPAILDNSFLKSDPNTKPVKKQGTVTNGWH